jgi:FixJ family two-component response regulator
VLIDWSLPDIGGAELARAIDAKRPGVCVLLMTGHVFTPETGHPVLRKPFSLNDLAEALRLAIRERVR